MLPLETPRLRLRLPSEPDLDVFGEIHREPQVARAIIGGVRPDAGPEIAWRNLAMQLGHWQLRGFGSWLVEERATGAVIGRVGFWNSSTWPGVELGWLIRESRTNQGFATEAAARAIEWARTETSIDHIISMVHPEHAASIRIAEKIGEEFEQMIEFSGVTYRQYGLHLRR